MSKDTNVNTNQGTSKAIVLEGADVRSGNLNTNTDVSKGANMKDTNTSNTPKVIKKMVNGKEKTFNYRDQAAPKHLKVTIEDENGQLLQTLIAVAKNFKTGSVGYYCGDKLTNPMNPDARYQVGMNFTLINSKPE